MKTERVKAKKKKKKRRVTKRKRTDVWFDSADDNKSDEQVALFRWIQSGVRSNRSAGRGAGWLQASRRLKKKSEPANKWQPRNGKVSAFLRWSYRMRARSRWKRTNRQTNERNVRPQIKIRSRAVGHELRNRINSVDLKWSSSLKSNRRNGQIERKATHNMTHDLSN